MRSKYNTIFSIVMFLGFMGSLFSQQTDLENDNFNKRKFTFLDYRGTNAIDIGVGTDLIIGDYPESEFELYFRLGYKRQVLDHVNVNFTFNKYNISIKDIYNEGFLSLDLNLEYLFSPYTKFSPFLYVGGGYNASNYFVTTATKVQGGFGFEYIVAKHFGFKLFGEYNYMFTDELDGFINGATDDILIRMGLGFNIYFGGAKKKEAYRRKLKTVINSNLIIPYY